MSGLLYKQADSEWSTSRNWYNNRVMDTFISSPIVDKQGDMIPTETLKESMNFYMKYGIYAYKHDEIPIGQPLAWRIKDGKVLLKVGIHNKLDMHDKIWKEIQQFGSKGASSIRGEALSQNQVCPPGESCFTKIDKLGLWSVSWVGDSPANPEATVQTVSMAKEDENIGSIVSENELESNSHIKKCGECSKPVEKCGKCNKPVEKRNEARDMFQALSVLSRSQEIHNATKLYQDVSREVERISRQIFYLASGTDTSQSRKTYKILSHLQLISLSKMEMQLIEMKKEHDRIVREMDKAYKAVEGMGSR